MQNLIKKTIKDFLDSKNPPFTADSRGRIVFNVDGFSSFIVERVKNDAHRHGMCLRGKI